MHEPPIQYTGFDFVDYASEHNQSSSTPLVDEVPVAISINGISHAVLMATPIDLDALAVGFALSEGIIQHANDIRDINPTNKTINTLELSDTIGGISIDLTISSRLFSSFKQRRNNFLGASGCGLCGIESIEQALPVLSKLPPSKSKNLSQLASLRQKIDSYQTLGNKTGALHAALLLTHDDNVICTMEDIGRHNALDKVIGYALQHKINLLDHNVLMSSRCSSELVQKAVRSGLSNLTHLASPSSLAVKLAKHYGLRLIHLPKRDAPRLYSDPRYSNPEE